MIEFYHFIYSTNPHGRCGDCTTLIVRTNPGKDSYLSIIRLPGRQVILKIAANILKPLAISRFGILGNGQVVLLMLRAGTAHLLMLFL